MHEEFFRALDQGGTIITATRRLARSLTYRWHSFQKAQGRSTWSMPDILPLEAFLDRQWRNWVLHGASEGCPRLLERLQEQVIWEQIILESPAGETLLQIQETARAAIEAWRLVQAYRVPMDGRFEATDDWAAFRDWSETFRKRCQANRWMEQARLADYLRERITVREISIHAIVYLVGFDDLTPQQSAFFETLNAREIATHQVAAPAIELCKAAGAEQEIQAAAEWSRRILSEVPDAQIGIVVPDLKRSRIKIERIFGEALDPAGRLRDRERSFHVSLGPVLREYPLVRAALLLLEFGATPLILPQAGVLLRSPFLGGAESEGSSRALLDAKLRKQGAWDITVDGLREAAGSCPILQRLLRRFAGELNHLPEKQSAQEWGRFFSRLLNAVGWPGDRPPNSREYQTLEAWDSLLSSLGTLDLAVGPASFAQALSRLQDIASRAPFQVENEGAQVQIMGMLEATGLNFDHLWIMGLNDETLPAPASPNPFLPISLQREYNLPHSSTERELEFSKNLMRRLVGSAPNAVLSYSERDGDRTLSPSPLVPAGSWVPLGDTTAPTDWITRIQASASMEQIEDDMAPAAATNEMQAGGSSLFKDMAACPFRAFAKHRLHARPLEDRRPGPTYKDRGNAVHKALELIWRELGSHACLTKLNPEQLRDLVASHVRTALKHVGVQPGRALEQRRLENLLAAWLEIEKSRDPFIVSRTEDERCATVNGLQVRTRADRMDELPDGRAIIIDYKTGQLVSNAWDGERPDEPQLPLYCIGGDRPIAGVAFAQIRAGELGFRSLTEKGLSLPVKRSKDGQHTEDFREQVAEWEQVLRSLAGDFLAGLAQVDPKPAACDHCGLTSLCRIRELDNANSR